MLYLLGGHVEGKSTNVVSKVYSFLVLIGERGRSDIDKHGDDLIVELC